MKKSFSVVLFFVFIGFSSCRHDPDIPLSPILTYDADIKTIISNNCAISGCHDGNGRKQKLTSYSQVLHYVTPGKPYQSNLFTSMVQLTGNKMPPTGQLADVQIRAVYIWILQGAKEN
jgi:hypothetical protein